MMIRPNRFLLIASCILVGAGCLPSPAPCLSVQAPGASTPQQPPRAPAPLDINRATAEDFATLPGVGPELARRIVAFREKHGPYRRIEDLMVVEGMGRKKWRAIRPLIRVEDSPPGASGP
jgi:competence protein ComEA